MGDVGEGPSGEQPPLLLLRKGLECSAAPPSPALLLPEGAQGDPGWASKAGERQGAWLGAPKGPSVPGGGPSPERRPGGRGECSAGQALGALPNPEQVEGAVPPHSLGGPEPH